MKTDKEYPATHSMATSWFGIDKEGNVALIEFDDNGPVPYDCGDQGLEDIISNKMTEGGEDEIRNLNFTLEQALELMKKLEEPTIDKLDFPQIVKISPEHTDSFKRLCLKNHKNNSWDFPYVIICEEARLYIADFYKWDKRDKEYLLHNNIIEGIYHYYIDTYTDWDTDIKKYVHTNTMDGYPYFLYQQPYSPNRPTDLTYIPAVPLKAEQLSDTVRSNALHFPVSFKDSPHIFMEEFFQCKTYGDEYVSYEGIRKVTKKSAEIGIKKILVRENILGVPDCKRCGKCKFPKHQYYKELPMTQYGLSPTVIGLVAPIDIYDPNCRPPHYKEWSEKRINKERLLWLPVIPGVPTQERNSIRYSSGLKESIGKQNMKEWFSNCRCNFEESLSAIYPRAIVATQEADLIINAFFQSVNNTIEIAGNSYPYFVMTEDTNYIDEINVLAQLPYRGIRPPRIEYIDVDKERDQDE
ncbi:MAG: hypothetical protein K2I18_02600 [Paramuribaculum sp.]|nr:hypothetical protein [Paramuribaculum sp.]